MASKGLVHLTGFKEIEAALLKLPKELAMDVERDVVRAGMVPVRKAARRHATAFKDTGLLAKSIGLNVRRVRRKLQFQNRYTARVGAQNGHRKEVIRRIKGKTKNGVTKVSYVKQMANPANYSHLVEYGTSHSPAQPFIRPALDECEPQIIELMARGYEKGLTKAVAKLRKGKYK